MGLIKKLFGCTNHHWGNERFTGEIKIRDSYKGRLLMKKVKETCQHSGCRSEKTSWKVYPQSDLPSINISPAKLDNAIKEWINKERMENMEEI